MLVVHENRGLNPYIEDVARRLATANFMAFAPDGLTSVGGYPGDDEKAAAAFGKGRPPDKMPEGFRGGRPLAEGPGPIAPARSAWWASASAGHRKHTRPCGWDATLRRQSLSGEAAAAADAAKIKAPLLLHYASLDTRLDRRMAASS